MASLLDAAAVREALGQRLGERFLQYAQLPEHPGDEGRLAVHLDEHLAAVQRRAIGADDLRTASRLAQSCKRLIMRYSALDDAGKAAVVGAVRYFLDTHDLDRDDAPLGFNDDAQVVNHVLREFAPDLPLVAI